MSVIRTLNTLRHLRPVQVTDRLGRHLRALWERPESFFRQAAPPFPGCLWPGDRHFLPPNYHGNSADSIKAGRFRFINREELLQWPPADWALPGMDKLWQYNLHYGDWLWALDYAEIREGITAWIGEHPLTKGQVGWEPYPTSLRLMNWCALCYGRHADQIAGDREFQESLWTSIHHQASWLSRHLERHLLGNHLLENGAALTLVGSCFSGAAAQNWVATGMDILKTELPAQILADGMHFERSPMYHLRVTYLLHQLQATGVTPVQELIRDYLPRLQRALTRLCHPDGQIALLNDSAFGIYNEPAQLLAGEEAPGTGAFALPAAGYYGYRDDRGTYLIADAGPLGPDYIPGHAHGDIFSFELSLKGQRVIVDSGVYDYVPGEMRTYCRSTPAHNTVTIAGEDQGEFWASFRVGRRGYPRQIGWTGDETGLRVSGYHDGYHRLPGRPTHYRALNWHQARGLQVVDRIEASRPVSSVSRLHLHPHCRLSRLAGTTAHIIYPAGAMGIDFSGPGQLTAENTWYCPEFGLREKNITLAYSWQGTNTETSYTIVPI